jgi:hypothetical protein
MKNYRFTDFQCGYSSEMWALENSRDEANTKTDAREMGWSQME